MVTISNKLKLLMKVVKAGTIISRKFGSQGLGFGDLAVLYAINQAPEGKIRRIDLADAVGLTPSGVTRMLIPLEKIGVIKREAHERDARASYVAMTESGREMFQNALRHIDDKCGDLLLNEPEKKLKDAALLLDKISQ
ncbi:MAG: MarR family transcriptional regulator [Patescibacteria group bacterium]|nr:MarR family transcriptional regulator [Patescibacteria group bacterium]